MAIQSKQELDNILQDLRHFTQTVSQTGVSQAVSTRGPCRPDVTPPPSPSPITDAPCEWEDETFNAFVSTKQAQTFAAPAIKPQTPKTNAFSSTKQIQDAAAPVSKPTAPTTSTSSAPTTKPLAAKTDAFLPATKTSAAPASKPITPKANAFATRQQPHAAIAPVSKTMTLETNGLAAKPQRQVPVVSGSQSWSTGEVAPPPPLQVSRQTFIFKVQPQVSSTPVNQSFLPMERPLSPSMTRTRSTIAPQPQLQAPRPTPKVAQPVVEPSLAPTVDAGGWEEFENPFANDFKTAFANSHPKVKTLS
jgi:hypothetical protein